MELCRGPHLPSTKHIGTSFKLMKVAGAYWRGNENNKITALNRSFYEGVKNNRATTLDGDDSIIIRVSSPTVAVPIDATDSNLNIMDTEW